MSDFTMIGLPPTLLSAIEEFASVHPECRDGDYVPSRCKGRETFRSNPRSDWDLDAHLVWFEQDPDDEQRMTNGLTVTEIIALSW